MADPTSDSPSDQDALLDVLQAVMSPLAQLAVSKGLSYAGAEEALKRAYVRAAREAQIAAGHAPHRLVSRISTTTGINRREVTRLTEADTGRPPPAPVSHVSALFTRWLSDPNYCEDGQPGVPKRLPRQGLAPSFETLARSVTQDVHPRSLLDELVRLGMAELVADGEQVQALQAGFVPAGDWQRMLGFLRDNVSDHLQAAVSNVLSDKTEHFEQAVFADGLSQQSVMLVRELARDHWKRLLSEAVSLLEQRIELDKQNPARATERVRLGLFTFHGAQPAPLDKDAS